MNGLNEAEFQSLVDLTESLNLYEGEGVNIKHYQAAVSRTMNHGLSRQEALSNYSMGLAGETGEVLEPLKKHLFHSHSLDLGTMEKELGDVCWYVAALANELGINLGAALEKNLEKLARRYPNGFDQTASKERKE